MPAPHPRRPWRFTVASAVSATLLAVIAGCGEPSHAGNAATAPAGVAGSGASATTAASPTPSASATPTKTASPSGKTFMGKNTVSIGRTSTGKRSVDAPFDAQYQYVV